MGISTKKIMYWPQWAEAFFSNITTNDHYHDDNIPVDGFKIMFAGNIGSCQDFETIVEAATILKDKNNIQFLILGDGLMKKWAQEEVVKRKLPGTFHFLGQKPVEMMPFYFSKADVLIVSLSDSELFSITVPGKVQAYLASGKPILGSLNGEGAQIINQWKAGLTCDASNPPLLAKRIEEMSNLSKEELGAMGKNARTCYLAEFEREKLISILEDELRLLR
jgi:glycosyltransferase involved in cell wall biosynthesis